MAVASALIWTVHPLNSEVVDYLSERSDAMMTLCYVFTLYAVVRAHGSPHSGRWQIAAIAACAAGMLCKESMVTAPVVVLLYDVVFLSGSLVRALRVRWRLWVGLATTWVLLLPSFAARGAISTGGFSSAHATPWTYLLNQTEIVTRYLWLSFWPAPLVNYYGWTRPLTLGDVWPYALVLIVLLLSTAWLFRWRPRVGFAAVCVFVILAPTSSLMPIAAEVGAERRMYLPLAGLIVIVVIGARALWSRPPKSRGLAIACVLVATVFAGMTRARNREYASALTMAHTVLARWPTPAAHHLVGLELALAGRHEDAIAELRVAAPDYAPSRFYLGSELVGAGQPDEAIATLQSFLRDEPDVPVVPNARTLLARAHYARQRWSEAIAQSELALAAKPDDVVARGILADGLLNLGRADEAIPQYRAIAAAAPSHAGAWSSLGLALVSAGKTSEATEAFARAVVASPRDARLRQNLARALIDAGRASEAEPHARQAIALAPADPGGHDVLARVFVAQGQIEDARKAFASALQLDPSYAPAQDGLRALRGR
jgi:tetratricopeptide (TPR) repeat protein